MFRLNILLISGLISATTIVAQNAYAAEDTPKGCTEIKNKNDEEQFIKSVSDKIITLITDKNRSQKQLEDGFREILNANFHLDAIAKFVLGKHHGTASKEELKEFRQRFEDSIVKTYTSQFKDYSGETLCILKSEAGSDGGKVVFSQIVRQKPVAVNWYVLKGKISDVIVEGVSMSITQRSEYAAIINKRGDGVKGLNQALRENLNTVDAA